MDRLPVWIHLKHVPLELFTGGGLSYIASALGNPLYMDGITASKQRLSHAKVCVELSVDQVFPRGYDDESIKTIATSSNSPDSTRKVSSRKGKNVLTGSSNRFEVLSSMEDVGLPSTSVTSNVENDSDSRAASMGIVTLMQAMKTKKKGKIERSRSMVVLPTNGVYGSNIGGERKRLWEHLKDVKESVGAKPFRFFNFWAKHPDFMKTVEQSWKEPVDGDPMSRLMKQSRQPIKLLTYDDDNRLETYEQISMESIRFYSGLIGTADKGVKGLFNPIS
ncbi:hypothetical protein Gogos_001646 [Gossypium gossypioides]|uniref:DUF4283 domain-containing protein n=1 Tax=Gossypium gossypioides TaxID=34282 RepID=A0A7J9CPF7_GOSGO|nr:hypothetical protein [Gossypium gossypioides]